MTKIFSLIISLFLFLFLVPRLAKGANFLDVVINEIAWMGTLTSANDEWLELSNGTFVPINISGWTLKAEDGSPLIILEGTIPALGYFLLERTDDQTLPGLSADQIYTGSLENTGEKLELRDQNGNLIDLIDCSSGWFSGDNTTKQTMERKDSQITGNISDNWQNSLEPGGTPKAKNRAWSKIQEDFQPKSLPSPSPSPFQTPLNSPPVALAGDDIIALVGSEITFDGSRSFDPDGDELTYFWNFGDGSTSPKVKEIHIFKYPGIYTVSLNVSDGQNSTTDTLKVSIFTKSLEISEFIPNPQGKDEENEWIELYNSSDQVVEISGWKLKSKDKTFTLPEGSFISPKQFLVFPASITKIALPNTEGSLNLYYPNGFMAQRVEYQEAKEGWSIAKIGNEYLWTSSPTPGFANKSIEEKSENILPTPLISKDQVLPEPSPTKKTEKLSEKIEPSPQASPDLLVSESEKDQKEIPLTASSQEGITKTSNFYLWLTFLSLIFLSSLAGWGLIKIKNKI